MKPPRGLSEAEQALWESVARTVTPLIPARPTNTAEPPPTSKSPASAPRPLAPPLVAQRQKTKPVSRQASSNPVPPPPPSGLDSHWERRLRSGLVAPDFTLDLHGHTLDQAHRRLDAGLAQARALGARLVLVISGKPRPVDAADRAHRRGAIRAKLIDWLAAGPHASDIAAIRPAHPRYGGEGALYLILRRRR